MLIVYDSRSGNVKRFLSDCGLLENALKLNRDLRVGEPFVLVTYTTTSIINGEKFNGYPPTKTLDFLEYNHEYLVGVSASGEKNWGKENFARSADKISEMYKAKLISRFERRGNEKDREVFLQGVKDLEDSLSLLAFNRIIVKP